MVVSLVASNPIKFKSIVIFRMPWLILRIITILPITTTTMTGSTAETTTTIITAAAAVAAAIVAKFPIN